MPNRVVRFLFDTWESLFHKAAGLREIEPGQQHLFFIARRKYLGEPFSIDGVEVRPRDLVIELHFNNEMVEQALRADDNIVRAMIQILREARQSMPALARAIGQEEFREAKALYGITFIHRGIERFGFETRDIPSGLSKAITSWHLKNVLRMLNPSGEQIIHTHASVLQPKLVVASKERIIKQFLEQDEFSADSKPANTMTMQS